MFINKKLLIVVISLITLTIFFCFFTLVALGFYSLKKAQVQARDASRKLIVMDLALKSEEIYLETGNYPTEINITNDSIVFKTSGEGSTKLSTIIPPVGLDKQREKLGIKEEIVIISEIKSYEYYVNSKFEKIRTVSCPIENSILMPDGSEKDPKQLSICYTQKRNGFGVLLENSSGGYFIGSY